MLPGSLGKLNYEKVKVVTYTGVGLVRRRLNRTIFSATVALTGQFDFQNCPTSPTSVEDEIRFYFYA